MKTKIVVYPAVFTPIKGKAGHYFVQFPDVPAAITEGHSWEEAIKMASDALGMVLVDMKGMPKVSEPDEIDAKGSRIIYISTDLEAVRRKSRVVMVHKNVSIPADLALQAEAAGLSFSGTLAKALREALNQ